LAGATPFLTREAIGGRIEVYGWAQPSPRFFSSSLGNEDFDGARGATDVALRG